MAIICPFEFTASKGERKNSGNRKRYRFQCLRHLGQLQDRAVAFSGLFVLEFVIVCLPR
jgi:hypothetical protein